MAEKFITYLKALLRKPKASIFLMFLIVSSLVWFLISLSDTYISYVSFDLLYKGIPEDKLVLGKPKRNLQVNIEASGYKILNYRIFKRELNVYFSDFHKSESAYYMLEDDLKEKIHNQYKSLRVSSVFSDSLLLKLGVNKKKYVKVIPDVAFSFEEDYQFVEDFKTVPDSIWVRGPEDQLEKIQSVKTLERDFKNIQASFETEIELKIPENLDKIEYQAKKVVVTGVVDRFSEKIIEVSVKVINQPENVSLKLYPEKVRLLCKAPIGELKRINEAAFSVVCDYNGTSEAAPFLIPILENSPKFVTSAIILDKKIEFLIKRKNR